MIIKDVDGVDLTPRARSLRLLFYAGGREEERKRGREEERERVR